MSTYLDEAAPSPYQRPTDYPIDTDSILRYVATRGLRANERLMTTPFPEAGNAVARKIWNMELTTMIAMHDLHVALDALQRLSIEKADEVARTLVNAADAGDSYGEWFWEWCFEKGIDPQKIIDEMPVAP